jgi:hypothetical protein
MFETKKIVAKLTVQVLSNADIQVACAGSTNASSVDL